MVLVGGGGWMGVQPRDLSDGHRATDPDPSVPWCPHGCRTTQAHPAGRRAASTAERAPMGAGRLPGDPGPGYPAPKYGASKLKMPPSLATSQ